MSKICVLVTGGGSPGIAGTIHALRKNEDGKEVKIVAVDARDDVVGKYLADKFYQVKLAEDKDFLDSIVEVCKKEKVDVILPQVTKELDILSSNKNELEKLNIHVAVMKKSAMEVANNKYYLMEKYVSLGLKQGKFRMLKSKKDLLDFAKEIDYPNNPFVVKPPLSNGMRGLRIVTPENISMESFLNSKPSDVTASLEKISALFDLEESPLELIGMEYFPGMEYTVDVYRSPLSKKMVVIPRSRDVIRTGITFEGELIKNEEMISISEKLANELDMTYCFGFQYKFGNDGLPHLLECNPRIQGTMIMSVLGGANMIYWSVKEALGVMVDLDKVEIKWGMKFKRYWGGMGIHDGKITKIL